MTQISYSNITASKRLIGPSVQEGEMAVPSVLARPSKGHRVAIPITRYPLVTVLSPQIIGVTALPSELSIVPGIYDGSPQPHSYTYQWLRNGVPIAGETGPTYTTVYSDYNTYISVFVTATSQLGSVSNQTNRILVTVFESIDVSEAETYVVSGLAINTAMSVVEFTPYLITGLAVQNSLSVMETDVYIIDGI